MRTPEPLPRLVLVLPDDHEAVSGGNLYNAHLLGGLARIGADHEALGFTHACALADAGGPALFVVDSVLHERLPELVRRAGARQAVFVLVHYLPLFERLLEGGHEAALAVEESKRLFAGVFGFVANSAFTQSLLGWVADDRPILVAPPAPVLKPRGNRPRGEGFCGLLVGNLIRAKGILRLLHSLDAVLDEDDSFALEVLGRSDLEPEYAAACQDVLDGSPRLARRVRLRGIVPPHLMPGVYEESSVFVSAAGLETFGMAMAEARAFGLPILALDAGNARAHVSLPAHGRLYATEEDLAAGSLAFARDTLALQRLRDEAFGHRFAETRAWEGVARDIVRGLLRALAEGPL